jgi:hypothetical protein
MPGWQPMRSFQPGVGILDPLTTASRMASSASAWGGGSAMQYALSDAYNLGFSARAAGQPIGEEAWRAIAAGRPSGSGYISPHSPYRGTWSPYLSGSGVRGLPVQTDDGALEALAEEALAGESFGLDDYRAALRELRSLLDSERVIRATAIEGGGHGYVVDPGDRDAMRLAGRLGALVHEAFARRHPDVIVVAEVARDGVLIGIAPSPVDMESFGTDPDPDIDDLQWFRS